MVSTDSPIDVDPFERAATAWAEPLQLSSEPPARARALMFDATGLSSPNQLRSLYSFFHERMKAVRACGRVLVLARPPNSSEPQLDAARQALEGFTRSLAKELGRKGTTANLLWIESGAESLLPGCLRFFLSGYSAFITAQPLFVTARAARIEKNDVESESSLRGKVALVTGAARGIGAETARSLAREGAHVIVLDRPGTETDASRLARDIGGSMLLLDVSKPESPDLLSEYIAGRHGALDVVVHNAGLTRDRTLGRMPREDWEAVLSVNLEAVVRMTEALLSKRQLRDEGRVIVLSSVGGIAGNAGQTNYAASKAGLIGYTRALSGKLAERGICVNAVAPGFIETQMTARMPLMIREAARRLSALGQGGRAADVAEAVTFLALPMSQGVTGNVLRVCGGALIGA